MVPKIIVCVGLTGFPVLAQILIDFTGSGKTSLTHGLANHIRTQGRTAYVVNLDPAVVEFPYKADFDIREYVNHRDMIAQCSAFFFNADDGDKLVETKLR